jgi:hypothetical protein
MKIVYFDFFLLKNLSKNPFFFFGGVQATFSEGNVLIWVFSFSGFQVTSSVVNVSVGVFSCSAVSNFSSTAVLSVGAASVQFF